MRRRVPDSRPMVPGLVQIVTPTRERPEAFSLLEKWVERQTYDGPIKWTVVNDGQVPYEYTMGQDVHVRKPCRNELGYSLCHNMDLAYALLEGEFIIIMEDDDWYCPTYVEELVETMKAGLEVVGYQPALYYNVEYRRAKEVNKRGGHCSFGQTAFTHNARLCLWQALRRGRRFLDIDLWKEGRRRRMKLCYLNNGFHEWNGERIWKHVGIKRMPGVKNIGCGKNRSGRRDPNLKLLIRWLGSEHKYYLPYVGSPK